MPGCVHQTYWYENEVQRARFCDKEATRVILGGGVPNRVCDEHAEMMLEAGASEVVVHGTITGRLGRTPRITGI